MVLQRHKSTIYGLTSDLLALQTADASETSTRISEITRVEGLVSAEEATRLANDNTLQSNIDAEAATRAANDGDLTTLTTTAKGNLVAAINELVTAQGAQGSDLEDALAAETAARIAADDVQDDRLDIIEGDATVDGSIAKSEADSKAYADSIVTALADGRVTDLETLTTLINGDSSVDGSFRKAIADVIGTAPEALDTLAEIAAAINNDEAVYDTLVNLVNTGLSDLNDEILGTATAAMDTLGEVEAKLAEVDSTIAANAATASSDLSDAIAQEVIDRNAAIAVETAARIADVDAEEARAIAEEARIEGLVTAEATTARAAELANANAIAALDADTYSMTETDEAIRLGGAVFVTEMVNVAADKIVLAQAPKNGVIFNFGTVRHTDSNFVSYDVPATITVTEGGKEFLLSPNVSGEFDGKPVMVQYAYIPVA